jgi:cyanophycinase-like exopeptidase
MIYLLGSGQPSGPLFDDLLDRAFANLRGRTGRVALSLAAIADQPSILRKFAGWFVSRTFRGAKVTRFSVSGEADAQSPAEARRIVEEADLIFLGGGDPTVGAKILRGAGADAWLRAARDRGAVLSGGSAGAILLGAFWAEWPEKPEGRPFDGGELVACTGVVGDLVVDTHDEKDGWGELKLVHGMLRAAGHTHRVRGIPTRGGLVVHDDGRLESTGDPVFALEP